MELLDKLLQNYQAVVTIIAILSPFVIVILTNRHSSQLKKLENELALQKERLQQELNQEFQSKGKQHDHENLVLSSLVKILFEVQKLHIDISCGQDDAECIDRGVADFQSSLSKHQAIISDNQLYLPSQIIDRLYRFYRQLAGLLIELQNLKRTNQLDVAIACVYDYAQQLANEVIEVQDFIVQRRTDLAVEFKKEHLEMMRYCCGTKPSPEVQKRYKTLKKKVEQLPIPEDDAMVKLELNS